MVNGILEMLSGVVSCQNVGQDDRSISTPTSIIPAQPAPVLVLAREASRTRWRVNLRLFLVVVAIMVVL